MNISNEIRARVIAAADEIYRDNERQRFPLVDEVRRLSRVGMNDCSAVMKEWRRAQTAAVVSIVVEVPEKINAATKEAVAEIWGVAQELANESLLNAQQAWESEREGAESLRVELSEAYEAVSGELVVSKEQLERVELDMEKAEALVEELKRQLLREETLRVDLEKMVLSKDKLIGDLKEELRVERDSVKRIHEERSNLVAQNARLSSNLEYRERELIELKTVAEEAEAVGVTYKMSLDRATQSLETANQTIQRLESVNEKSEAIVEKARKEAALARENAASLQGQIESLKHINSEVVNALRSLKSFKTEETTENQKGGAKSSNKSEGK